MIFCNGEEFSGPALRDCDGIHWEVHTNSSEDSAEQLYVCSAIGWIVPSCGGTNFARVLLIFVVALYEKCR